MSELDRLIRFAAVAEDLSFSRAARRLGVDQPWLSRQIQQMEAHLGVSLFVRSTRKVELTEHGERLLEDARALVDAAEDIRRSARDLGRSHSSTVRFGMNPYTYWVLARERLLNLFATRYPRATVDVVNNYTPRLISRLRKRVFDVVLIPAPCVPPDFKSLILHSSRPSLLVPREDPLARRGAVELGDLRGRRFAATAPHLNSAVYEHMYGPLVAAGAEPFLVAEGAPAVSFYAQTERLILLCHSWPESCLPVPEDFEHVELLGEVPQVEYAIACRREAQRPVVNQFWKVADEVRTALKEAA